MKTDYILKTIIVIVLLSLFVPVCFSQNTVAPYASSDAAVMISNIQNPVDYSTGAMSVQVPLHTISSGGITIPISLSYQATGLKVGDTTTRVGLGWHLSAGGQITRMMKGRIEPGFGLSTRQYTDITQAFAAFFGSNGSEDIKTEPDLFYFEIPGRSGVFFMDAKGQYGYTMPYQPIIIKFIPVVLNGQNIYDSGWFTITDEQGTVYTFTRAETTCETKIGDKTTKDNYVSTWYLDGITTIRQEQAFFTYVDGKEEKKIRDSYTDSYNTPDSWLYQTPVKKHYIVTDQTTHKVLSQIQCGSTIASFEDNSNNLLANIKISENSVAAKNIVLSYKQINYPDDPYYFLTDINLQSPNGGSETLPVCSFQYNTLDKYNPNPHRDLLALNSNDYDYWGYCNGDGTKNSMTDYCFANDGSYAYRNPDPYLEYTKVNILTSIKYATGGEVQYDYGQNFGLKGDASTGLNGPIGGLRIEKITMVDKAKNKLVTSYRYEEGKGFNNPTTQCTFSLYKINGVSPFYLSSTPLNNVYQADGHYIVYGTVTETLPNGDYTVYTYYLNEPEVQDSHSDSYTEVHDSNKNITPYRDNTTKNDYSLNSLGIFCPNSSKFWRRGLISSIKKYRNNDSYDNPISEVKYYYDFPQSPQSRQINGYMSYHVICGNEYYTVGQYVWESQPVLLKSVEQLAGPYNQKSVTTYDYDPTDMTYYLPIKVTQTDAEGNNIISTTKYSFNYNAPTGPYKTLLDSHVLVPLEQVSYLQKKEETEAQKKVISGQITEYESFSSWPQVPLPLRKKQLVLTSPASDYMPMTINSDGKSISCDGRYESIEYYDSYNMPTVTPSFVLTSMHTENGPQQSLIYDQSKNVIASISNGYIGGGFCGEVFYTSFEDSDGEYVGSLAKTGEKVCKTQYNINLRDNLLEGTYILTYWQSKDGGATWKKETQTIMINSVNPPPYPIGGNGIWIDEVRIIPANASMTTYFYGPYGKTSEMDTNGRMQYWEYDGFGRLSRILNNDKQLVKSYKYNAGNNNLSSY